MEEKLKHIIELSEICGKWSEFLNKFGDLNDGRLATWQRQSREVREKRDGLFKEFLNEFNDKNL